MLKAASRLLENSLTACTADLGETSPIQKQMFALHENVLERTYSIAILPTWTRLLLEWRKAIT
jgi:hypothetical protein